MLDFMVRFVLATLKLVLKITFIVGGLVFSSLGNAVTAMLGAEDGQQAQDDEMAKIYRNSFVVDEVSAAQALNNGDITSDEFVYYQED